MKKYFSYSLVNLYAMIFAFGLLGGAAYLQIHFKQEPCPLCVIQRLIVAILALMFLAGAIYRAPPSGRKKLGLATLLVSLFGLAVAGRHVYLQHLPPEHAPICGPKFNFLIHNLPLFEAIKRIFYGTGECAKVTWTFLHLSIAEWAFVCFAVFGLVALWQMVRK